jgi:pimeloyl-ACP methyl ester carboxylesterase
MKRKIFLFVMPIVLMAFFLFGAFPAKAAENFILSGGLNPTDNFCVDDDIYVYLNGELIYADIDPRHASCNNQPVSFAASRGEELRVTGVDSRGICRSIGPLWLHYGNQSMELFAGRNDGCLGWPAGVIFYDQTFILPRSAEPEPVIIVPGIMGSWYSDEDGWQLDPILNTYDNLWESFKLAGYEENKTLFAFPYQWRNSNVISAGYLKSKINEVKSICECEKVDIVAHSMGGLVTRYYVESDDYENDIDQIVFLGVPHKGAPKAYLQWEAAEGFERFEKLAKIYFSIEAHLLGYDSLFKYIQNKVKSVEQLLPDYAYLRDAGEISLRPYDKISYPNNYPYNNFLEDLNSEDKINRFINSGVNIFNIIGDTGNNTINVIEVSSGQEYWPMWMHGYKEEVIKLSGDDTVPEVSSSLFIPTKINNTNHNSLPAKAQKQIIEYLTGQMPVIEINNTPEPEEILVVAIYSPADFAIISPSGKRLGKDFLSNTSINQIDYAFYTGFEDEPEFAVIINPEQGDYEVELRGTGNGEYKLDLSYVDEEKEITKEFTGNIQTGEDRNFNFTYNNEGEDPVSELKPDDNIPPEITINNPIENEQYLHSGELTVGYTVTDDFSGVANTAIKLDNQILSTTTIDLFYYDLGEHILNITTVDNAGNSASVEVKFEIITNIDSTIQDIERIYDLGWISKKYIKQILIAELEVLRKRLDIFAKQKDNIEKLKQKLSDNPKIKEKHKQKLLDQFDKHLQELEQQEDKFIEKSLSLLVKTLDKFLQKAVISRQGYDIIISDIEYLKINLK